MEGALRIPMDTGILNTVGLALIFVGILVIVIATLLMLLASRGDSGKIRGGGAIIVGPVPIVFGTDKESLKTV